MEGNAFLWLFVNIKNYAVVLVSLYAWVLIAALNMQFFFSGIVHYMGFV